jgi:hypothetical protein
MISRNRESIPGQVPSFATPVRPLPFTFSPVFDFSLLISGLLSQTEISAENSAVDYPELQEPQHDKNH